MNLSLKAPLSFIKRFAVDFIQFHALIHRRNEWHCSRTTNGCLPTEPLENRITVPGHVENAGNPHAPFCYFLVIVIFCLVHSRINQEDGFRFTRIPTANEYPCLAYRPMPELERVETSGSGRPPRPWIGRRGFQCRSLTWWAGRSYWSW